MIKAPESATASAITPVRRAKVADDGLRIVLASMWSLRDGSKARCVAKILGSARPLRNGLKGTTGPKIATDVTKLRPKTPM